MDPSLTPNKPGWALSGASFSEPVLLDQNDRWRSDSIVRPHRISRLSFESMPSSWRYLVLPWAKWFVGSHLTTRLGPIDHQASPPSNQKTTHICSGSLFILGPFELESPGEKKPSWDKMTTEYSDCMHFPPWVIDDCKTRRWLWFLYLRARYHKILRYRMMQVGRYILLYPSVDWYSYNTRTP